MSNRTAPVERSRDIVDQGLEVLRRLRGAGAPPAPTSPLGTLAANQKKAADALAELIRTLSLT